MADLINYPREENIMKRKPTKNLALCQMHDDYCEICGQQGMPICRYRDKYKKAPAKLEKILSERKREAPAPVAPQRETMVVSFVRNCGACGAAKRFTVDPNVNLHEFESKQACDLCGKIGQWV